MSDKNEGSGDLGCIVLLLIFIAIMLFSMNDKMTAPVSTAPPVQQQKNVEERP